VLLCFIFKTLNYATTNNNTNSNLRNYVLLGIGNNYKKMQKTITHTDEQIETITMALRFVFDEPKAHYTIQIKCMNAMKNINTEAFEEMKSDLISEGIINE